MLKIICVIKFVITLILSVIDYLIFDDNSFKAEGRSKELMLSFFNKLFLWCQHIPFYCINCWSSVSLYMNCVYVLCETYKL